MDSRPIQTHLRERLPEPRLLDIPVMALRREAALMRRRRVYRAGRDLVGEHEGEEAGEAGRVSVSG